MWKIQQEMQDYAIRTARIHPDVLCHMKTSSRLSVWNFHMAKFSARLPRSRLEKPRSREPSRPALSYEHIENFIKDLEVRRDLGNRAHTKRPLGTRGFSGYFGQAFSVENVSGCGLRSSSPHVRKNPPVPRVQSILCKTDTFGTGPDCPS